MVVGGPPPARVGRCRAKKRAVKSCSFCFFKEIILGLWDTNTIVFLKHTLSIT
jgi:hypothetical protein